MARRALPFGSWPSNIESSALGSTETCTLLEPRSAGGWLYWLELRSDGTQVLMRWSAGRQPEQVSPAGISVRTSVHEYGGGAYCVAGDAAIFVNAADGRLYRSINSSGAEPITPVSIGTRYADLAASSDGRAVYAIRELHGPDGMVVNQLIAVALDGGEVSLLSSDHDFYAFPCPSRSRHQVAWIAWDHPNMPWDRTALYCAELRADGTVSRIDRLTTEVDGSVLHPAWDAGDRLHFVSDRTGWWNLYRRGRGSATALAPISAEFGWPLWYLGMRTYDFLPDGRIACAYSQDGVDHLGLLDASGLSRLDVNITSFGTTPGLAVYEGRIAVVAASPVRTYALMLVDADSGASELVAEAPGLDLPADALSQPRVFSFPTADGETAIGIHYPPASHEYEGNPGERPPLIVISHGGPTLSRRPELDPAIQFFTTRGFAVCQANYRGSSGFGTAYRNRLRGRWGTVDVEDCLEAARYLCFNGAADPARLVIRGGSAGGWTTLCALTLYDLFAAGASYWGVSDAAVLAAKAHKFESRYLEYLLGEPDQVEQVSASRSPLAQVHRFTKPVLMIQGLAYTIVPPDQAEMMVEALREGGVTFAYLTFAAEGHGLRRAENMARATEAELYFYSQILRIDLADAIEPIEIENLSLPDGGSSG